MRLSKLFSSSVAVSLLAELSRRVLTGSKKFRSTMTTTSPECNKTPGRAIFTGGTPPSLSEHMSSPHIQRLRDEAFWCSIKAVACALFAITIGTMGIVFHTTNFDLFQTGVLIALLVCLSAGYTINVLSLNERIRRTEEIRRTFHLERV